MAHRQFTFKTYAYVSFSTGVHMRATKFKLTTCAQKWLVLHLVFNAYLFQVLPACCPFAKRHLIEVKNKPVNLLKNIQTGGSPLCLLIYSKIRQTYCGCKAYTFLPISWLLVLPRNGCYTISYFVFEWNVDNNAPVTNTQNQIFCFIVFIHNMNFAIISGTIAFERKLSSSTDRHDIIELRELTEMP